MNNQFKALVKKVGKAYLESIQEANQDLISFGIWTDSDLSMLAFYYNTATYLQGRIQESMQEGTVPLDADKWFVNEWKSEEDGYYQSPDYTLLGDVMEGHYEEQGTIDFLSYKEKMFRVLCEALKELKEASLFDQYGEDFLLLIEEADNFDKEEHAESLSLIMNQQQLQTYLSVQESY